MIQTKKERYFLEQVNKLSSFQLNDELYGVYLTKDCKFKITKNKHPVRKIKIDISDKGIDFVYCLGSKLKMFCEYELWYNKENAIKSIEMAKSIEMEKYGDEYLKKFFKLQKEDRRIK